MNRALLLLLAIVSLSFCQLNTQPRLCLQQNCQNQMEAIKGDFNYRYCVEKCSGKQSTCLITCLPNDKLFLLEQAWRCSRENQCIFVENINSYQRTCLQWVQIADLQNVTNYKIALAQLQTCSKQCKNDEICWEKCSKADVVAAALKYYNSVNGICFPQYLTDLLCFKNNCPQEYQIIKEQQLASANKCYQQCKNEPGCLQKCSPIQSTEQYIKSSKCAQKNNCQIGYNPALVELCNEIDNYFAVPAYVQ